MYYTNQESRKNIKHWNIIVPIKREKNFQHGKPFPSLISNIVTSTILSFYGRRTYVVQLLQNLNHQSRAYIVAQEGLPGFLVVRQTNMRSWMLELLSKNQFDEYSLGEKLNTPINFIHMLVGVPNLETHLKVYHRRFYVAGLRALGKHNEI